MKKILSLAIFILSITLSIACITNVMSTADDPKENKKYQKEEAVKQLIKQQNYTFVAQTAIPLGAPSKQLNYGYDVSVSPDTVKAYLPYYGRGYTAPMDMTGGGVTFTSTDFDYKADSVKNGWNIQIKIKDDMEHGYELFLSISPSGSASLQVADRTRQSISFFGQVEENKQKSK